MLEIAIFLIGLFLGGLASRFFYHLYESHIDKLEGITTPKGYHLHHSMYGVMFLAVSPVMLNNNHIFVTVLMFGLGLGIIADHTLEEGFVFISKMQEDEASEFTEDSELY